MQCKLKKDSIVLNFWIINFSQCKRLKVLNVLNFFLHYLKKVQSYESLYTIRSFYPNTKQNLIKTINRLQPILHTLTSGYRSELLS